MKTQFATSQAQSSRLLQCGVSAETADMCWIAPNRLVTGGVGFPTLMCAEYFKHDDSIQQTPAWSLSALIGLLPPSITDENGTYFQLQLTDNPHEEDCYKWDLSYYSIECEISLLYIEAPDPIEACVRMIEELTANGYKLNEK